MKISREAPFILAFSADPGGARCLLPVIRELEKSFQVVTVAKDTGLLVFEEAGCTPIPLRADDGLNRLLDALLASASTRARAVLVLTSASSLPEVDMTEKRLWQWAQEQGIASVAVLDQWQNIARRFSWPGQSKLLTYKPLRIAVMDETVRAEMLANGFSAEQVVVTGQPYLEWFSVYARVGEATGRTRVRQQMQVEPEEYVICFVTEPVAMLYGRAALGFDELSILDEVLTALGSQSNKGCPLRVWIKLHPKSRHEDVEPCLAKAAALNLRLQVIHGELNPEETLWGTDLVVGMGSLLLVQAALLGRPVISAQIEARIGQPDICYLTQRGLIPRVTSSRRLQNLLDLLITDVEYRRAYLTNQAVVSSHEGATSRVAELCLNLIQKNLREHSHGTTEHPRSECASGR